MRILITVQGRLEDDAPAPQRVAHLTRREPFGLLVEGRERRCINTVLVAQFQGHEVRRAAPLQGLCRVDGPDDVHLHPGTAVRPAAS